MSILDQLRATLIKHIVYAQLGIIVLLGIASYSNTLNVPPLFDDDLSVSIANNIQKDITLYSFQGFIRVARWFTDVTFALNRKLHGEQVLGFHIVNLAIHLSSALVIYLFIQKCIEALRHTFQIHHQSEHSAFLQRFVPFTAAALFVCHPIQTQAVTYISQRYTSLAALLYISSLLSYLLARLSCSDPAKRIQVWAWGAASFLLAVLAMKSKEISFTLPIMAVALELVFFQGKLLKNRIFWAISAGLLLLIPVQLMYMLGAGKAGTLLHLIQSATTETPNIARGDYLLTEFRVIATYLRLLILPINQNLDYDYPVYYSLFDPSVFASFLLHVALAGLALFLFIRSGRHLTSDTPWPGVSMRLVCFGIFWFYLALSVESSLIPINDVIFEHRLYLPSAGFFMAAASCVAGLVMQRLRHHRTAWILAGLLCIVLTASTVARNRVWASELGLWQDVVEKSPNNARARHAVGLLYFKKFMLDKAVPQLVRSLELNADQDTYWKTLNYTISLLGKFEGRCSNGKQYQTTDNRVIPEYRKNWMAISHNNLGLAYEYLGNMIMAQENYQKAVVNNPSLDHAWYNLALIAALSHDTDNVITSLDGLNAINPLLAQQARKEISLQRQ
jgi:tetratricopeptide (TPR) repeat protein